MFDEICENHRQYTFLSAIKTVGWAIIQKKCSKSVFIRSFMPFYLDIDEHMRKNYLQEVINIYNMVIKNECTPDDLLLKLGFFTQYINEYDEYDDELVVLGPYNSDMIIDLFDKYGAGQCEFEAIEDFIDDIKMFYK